MAERPRLRELAERVGIVASYRATGGERRVTSDATREALLVAMGFRAGGEAAAAGILAEMSDRARKRLLPPVSLVFEDEADAARVSVQLAPDSRGPLEWRLELRLEDGRTAQAEGRAVVRRGQRRLALPLPETPGAGYHHLRVAVGGADGRSEAQQLRIFAPRRCVGPGELLGGRRGFGLWANLYTLRSRKNWGVGDLGDLRALVRFAGEEGAAFVGLSPLHALWNHAADVSPYAPVSRLFRNPLYLHVPAVPEFAACDAAVRPAPAELARLRQAREVDYERLMAILRPVFEAMHASFRRLHRGRDTARGRAYARFLEQQGEALRDFATFTALAEHFARRSGDRFRDWRLWPAPFQDARSDDVARFRDEHAEAVDLHNWLQFELDRQLADAGATARDAGLPIGIYADLAIGSASGGSDAWSFPGIFALGASAGAPPDAFARSGQDWSFPPLDPRRLRDGSIAFWIRLLRSAFAHSGALRIDHVMGLSRLYWIPAGRPPAEGAYVRYPERELLGILALESRRHRALVIGEDLGTVSQPLVTRLARRGVLSSRVLYFEREAGRFRPSRRYSRRALVTANTHDLAPLAGYAAGSDLAARRRAGQIESDAALKEEERRRDGTLRALFARLEAEGLLERGAAPPSPRELAVAVTAFLCRTPAPLVGLALDDLVGERVPVNLPGVGPDRHRSWVRRMTVSLEALGGEAGVRAILDAVPEDRRNGRDLPARRSRSARRELYSGQ
jgi:4-alpha-glucanotransferase